MKIDLISRFFYLKNMDSHVNVRVKIFIALQVLSG